MNKKDKKILLIFPPQWTPISPHFALASLLGQLKSNNYNAEVIDLNIDFYHEILNKKFLEKTIEKIKKDYITLFQEIRKIYSKEKNASKYSIEETCKLYKFNKLKNFVSSEDKSYEEIPQTIEAAKLAIRHEKIFYEPEHLIKAITIIDSALKLVSLAYCPTSIQFDACYNPFLKLNYNSIKHFVFDKNSNLFWDFFKDKISLITSKKPSLIAISLNSSSQLIPALTLCYLLKKYTKAHINIGGNFFGRIKEEIVKHPEFSQFCDSISIEEGEGPIIEMAKYVNNEINITNVPNLLHFKDNKVYENKKMNPVCLNKMANLNFDSFDLGKYFSPTIVTPYQTSRGCYWGKCTFCDQDFGQEFNVKEIHKVILEMKELKEKYGITCYEFIDESISPTYLKKLSKELLKTDIRPSFFADARLETQFDEEVFKAASKAGLKMLMWGLESGSKKIMESINKGIDLDKRFEIMKLANKYNIWNFAFIFFGYPLETVDDAKETIKMLCENHEIINSYGRSVFTMGRHAKIAIEPEKFGITKLYPAKDEFSPSIDFECIGMNKEELNKIIEECKAECFKHYKNPLWMFLRYREWLFLYINKYGVEWVKNNKVII